MKKQQTSLTNGGFARLHPEDCPHNPNSQVPVTMGYHIYCGSSDSPLSPDPIANFNHPDQFTETLAALACRKDHAHHAKWTNRNFYWICFDCGTTIQFEATSPIEPGYIHSVGA